MHLRVLEDTPTLHHVIVCTLCSCYPRPLLGHSPYWYRSPNYRRRLVRWPRQVLAEFGLILPPEVEVRVEDSNQKCRFMVLPVRPAGTEDWTEEQLAEIVTRDCMIGVALPRPTGSPTMFGQSTRPIGRSLASPTRRRPANEWRKRSAACCRGLVPGGLCPDPFCFLSLALLRDEPRLRSARSGLVPLISPRLPTTEAESLTRTSDRYRRFSTRPVHHQL